MEGARLADPRERGPLIADMTFMRLTRIERPKPDEPLLELRMSELLSGLHGSGVKFAFSIVACEEIVSVSLGAARHPARRFAPWLTGHWMKLQRQVKAWKTFFVGKLRMTAFPIYY